MCQALPTVPAAEGHQVDQLEPVILPTDSTGPERERERGEGGREGGRNVCVMEG